MYADIAFQQKIGDQETLCYKVPKTLETSIKEGQLVNLTLRRRTATGLIWRLHDEKPSFKTVDIKEITNETPLLTPDQIKLANWISEYYFAPLFKVLKLFVPAKIFKGKTMKPRIKEKPIPEKLNLKNLTIAQKNALDTIESAEHKSSSKTGAKVTPSNKFLIHG
ncbi:hypothetical protein HOE67_00890, partial [Candidatus Peregrinibacteria bacterium]|nr:hypothetical protein [Candidatus Peregrinibacteria bacterium]